MTVGILASLYSLALLVFTILLIMRWITLRRQVGRYSKYGIIAGFILIGWEVLIVVSNPGILGGDWFKVPVLIAIDAIAFVRLAAFTTVGMHYARVTVGRSFPLLLKNACPVSHPPFEVTPTAAPAVTAPTAAGAPEEEETAGFPEPPLLFVAETAVVPPDEAAVEPGVERPAEAGEGRPGVPETIAAPVTFTSSILAASVVAAAGILFTALLFKATSPRMSGLVKSMIGSVDADAGALTMILAGLAFAFGEEMVFRLGIQSFIANAFRLRGGSYWVAIVLTALLWTVGHTGVLEPDWVKLAQVFPFGLALGWLFRRYGTESCIIAHGVFNAILMPLAGYFVK